MVYSLDHVLQDDDSSPGAIVVFDKTVLLELVDEMLYGDGFVWAVSRSFTTDGRYIAGVDATNISSDVSAKSFSAKDIPIVLDNRNNGIMPLVGALVPTYIFVELMLVSIWIKCDDIVARRKCVGRFA
jgi:hypothetical protein